MSNITSLLQILLNGTVNASVYILVALGLTLMLGVLEVPNFAHGQTYAVGAFTTLVMMDAGVPFVGSLLGAVVVTAILGVAMDRLAYRPVKEKATGGISMLLVAFALFEIIGSILELMFGSNTRGFTFPISGSMSVAGVVITYERLLLLVVSAVLVVGVHVFIQRTRSGKAMRALSQDELKAKIVGVNPDRISILTFAVGSALAGVAGALIGGIYGLSAFMGLDVILTAFVIVVIGGMSSIFGAALAGLLIGVSESFVTSYFSAEFSRVVSFSLLLIFLLYRPQGLFGTAVEREG